MSSEHYGAVDTDTSNELLAFIERFGDTEQQYAVMLSTLLGLSKVMGINMRQVKADVHANWARVPAPTVIQEH